MMTRIKYWGIQISVNKDVNSLTHQQMRDEMWVGPHVRLTGMSGMAHIGSKNLADRYLQACIPVFDKRYKDGYAAGVVEWEGSSNKRLLTRVEKDSEIIKERLKTGNMAPNKRPKIV